MEIFVFPTTSADFLKVVTDVKAQSPDFVLFAGDLSDVEAFVKEAARQQFHPKGFSFSVGPSLPRFSGFQGVGNLASYLLGSTQWSPEANLASDDRYRGSKNFAKIFWDRYFTPAHYLPAGAVASGIVIEKALKKACGLVPAKVREELLRLSLKSFYGPISFNKQGLNVGKPIYTIQLQPQSAGTTPMKEVILHPFSTGQVVWPFPGFIGQ